MGFIHKIRGSDQHAGGSLAAGQVGDHRLAIVGRQTPSTSPQQPSVSVGQIDTLDAFGATWTVPARQLLQRLPAPLPQRLPVGQMFRETRRSAVLSPSVLGLQVLYGPVYPLQQPAQLFFRVGLVQCALALTLVPSTACTARPTRSMVTAVARCV